MTGKGSGRDLAATPALIVLMSSRLVIPGGLLSSRARFRFANRRPLCKKTASLAKHYFQTGQKRARSVKTSLCLVPSGILYWPVLR